MLLLLLIRIYWLIPKKHRKPCLFKESCSKYVFRITRESGFICGCKALTRRYKTCRPKYAFYTSDDGKNWVILNDDTIMERELTNI